VYEEEKRCLILGHFLWNKGRKSPLHVVCDYSNQNIIDLVTAYVPQMPWWISPIKRGKKQILKRPRVLNAAAGLKRSISLRNLREKD
jgi:hypothetical protein